MCFQYTIYLIEKKSLGLNFQPKSLFLNSKKCHEKANIIKKTERIILDSKCPTAIDFYTEDFS